MKNLLFIFFAFLVCVQPIGAQNAYLDSTFHFNGIQDGIIAATTQPKRTGTVLKIALQPDGKLRRWCLKVGGKAYF